MYQLPTSPDTERKRPQGTMSVDSHVELEKMKNFKWERPNRTAYHLGASHPKISPLLQVMS